MVASQRRSSSESASEAVREARYPPQPGLDPTRILQRWPIGIAVHQARKYHGKAYGRREVAVAEPLGFVEDQARFPNGAVEGRALLELLWLMEPRERRALVAERLRGIG